MLNEEQRYLFDTFGYLVVPGVLTAAQVDELRATLKQPTEQFDSADQKVIPLHWSKVWRDILDLPTLSPILEELIGNHGRRKAHEDQARKDPDVEVLPTFRLDHINVHTHIGKGFKGGMLHGGWLGTGGCQFFRYHDGRFYNGLMSVTFELHDSHANGGGFGCIPGTHKANLPLPERWRDLSQDVPDFVERVAARPGDAIVFTEALIHGTLPWTVDDIRSTVFYKFSPHASSWSGNYFDPDDFRDYPDMDDRKMAVLEPPSARYPGRPTRPRPMSER
ncbi:MAG: phytanoyl-CoA dioxygenase family protein [Gammaproteobacteria bacterium]|nr:phytanoyl-CoA dioxygenase family protein [Gammaproteobacteria bacterium]MYF27480.1 phytanoyl-CoA dioxygenase family protein [Gammaproteobacteria bacterium]MYK46461.1 phytanoyl-CoA dioxygenase family protein [Gammaproteobacteria bacterium]